jgi:hypothetical protein
MKNQIAKLYFITVFSIFILSCIDNNNKLDFNFLFNNSDIDFELLDILVEKYSDYDEDYFKIKNNKLFDKPLNLKVPEPRIYYAIKDIEQGGRISDEYYKVRYKGKFKRLQVPYKNTFIYYYYTKNKFNWDFIIILSTHTGEILYYATIDNS